MSAKAFIKVFTNLLKEPEAQDNSTRQSANFNFALQKIELTYAENLSRMNVADEFGM